jgi:hypothetical protein
VASLLVDTVFIDHDSTGREYHRTFVAGTAVHEARELGTGSKEYVEAFEACRRRCKSWGSDPDLRVLILDGLPRILHRKYWDSTFKERSHVDTSEN